MSFIDDIELQPITSGLGFHEDSKQKSPHPSAEEKKHILEAIAPLDSVHVVPAYYERKTSCSPEVTSPVQSPASPQSMSSPSSASSPNSFEKRDLLSEQKQSRRFLHTDQPVESQEKFSSLSFSEQNKPLAYSDMPVHYEQTSNFTLTSVKEPKSCEKASTSVAKSPQAPQAESHSQVIFCSPLAFVVDVLMLASTYIFVLFLLGSFMGADMSLLFTPQISVSKIVMMGALGLFLSGCYYVLLHILFGCTLGSWAASLSLGTDKQINSFFYPLKVCWRFFLLTLTGWATVPFLGALFKIDFLGLLTGLKLVLSEDEH